MYSRKLKKKKKSIHHSRDIEHRSSTSQLKPSFSHFSPRDHHRVRSHPSSIAPNNFRIFTASRFENTAKWNYYLVPSINLPRSDTPFVRLSIYEIPPLPPLPPRGGDSWHIFIHPWTEIPNVGMPNWKATTNHQLAVTRTTRCSSGSIEGGGEGGQSNSQVEWQLIGV